VSAGKFSKTLLQRTGELFQGPIALFDPELKKAVQGLPSVCLRPTDLALQLESEVFSCGDSDSAVQKLALTLTEPGKRSEFQFARKLLQGQITPHQFVNLDSNALMTAQQKRELQQAKEPALTQCKMP
jgi:hypothetical protein